MGCLFWPMVIGCILRIAGSSLIPLNYSIINSPWPWVLSSFKLILLWAISLYIPDWLFVHRVPQPSVDRYRLPKSRFFIIITRRRKKNMVYFTLADLNLLSYPFLYFKVKNLNYIIPIFRVSCINTFLLSTL